MTELIEKVNYKKSAWKNGQGSTEQIAIFPEQAEFPKDFFLWRISSARIDQNCSFSTFAEYDRLLVVISARGIVLNGKYLKPLEVIRFSGEESVDCHIEEISATDLGIIYHRDSCLAHMTLKTVTSLRPKMFPIADGIHFFHCLSGKLNLNHANINIGDTIKLSEESAAHLTTPTDATFIHIHISFLENKPEFCKV
jgi:environmental stress-induced protein Ves